MSNAITNAEQFGQSTEVTWGTTVSGNPMKLCRFTSINDNSQQQSTDSAETINARVTPAIVRTRARGGLTYNFEWKYGELDDFLEGLYGTAWSTNVLTVGTVRKSFSLERQLTGITKFHTYKGAIPTSLSLACQVGSILTGSMGFQSKFPIFTGTTAGTGTTAVTTNPSMDPVASVQLTQEGGSGAIAGVTDVQLSITQTVIDMPQLQSVDPVDLQPGKLDVQGSFTCYMQDHTYVDKFAAWTPTSIAVSIGGASSLKYAFLFSKVQLIAQEINNGGANAAQMQKFSFRGYHDATNTIAKLTRTP